MLTQSQGTLDPAKLAAALGLSSVRHRMKARLLRLLDPEVIRRFDEKNIPLQMGARDLTFVKPEYQLVVLREMERVGDWGPIFARSLILRAPPDMRQEDGKRRSPWSRAPAEREALASKLEDAERRHEFYAKL